MPYLIPFLSPYSYFDYAKFDSVDYKYCLLIPLVAKTNLPNIDLLLGELLAPLSAFCKFLKSSCLCCLFLVSDIIHKLFCQIIASNKLMFCAVLYKRSYTEFFACPHCLRMAFGLPLPVRNFFG